MFCQFTGDIDTGDLTEEKLEEYFALLRNPADREVRSATVRRYWQTVRAFCRWGTKKGYIPADIVPDVEMPRPDDSRRVLITDSEVATVLEATSKIPHPRRRALIRGMLYILSTAALRCNELADMKIEDVSLEMRQIRVVKGKGGKTRSVPINDKCIEAIREWLEIRPKNCQHPYLLAHDQTRRVSDFGIRNFVREAAHVAGFTGEQKDKFHPHTFRHNCALRFYINSKFDIYSTSKFLGHSQISTTQIYLNVDAIHLQEMRNLTLLAEPLPAALDPTLPAAAAMPDPADDMAAMERLMPMMMTMFTAMMKEFSKK